MLNSIAKLLKLLNSEGNPSQLSMGFVVGMIVGITPLWSLHNLLLTFLVFVFRVNLSAFILSFTLFSGIAYLVDPLMDQAGVSLLTLPAMHDFWTLLYNQPFWRLTHFNNSLTLGSLAISLLVAIPMFLISNLMIRKYRQHLLVWVGKSKLVQIIKGSRLYRLYYAVAGDN